MLVTRKHQRSVLFAPISIFWKKESGIGVIVVLNMWGVDYRYIINRISKSEAVKLLKNSNLSGKVGTL